jgi:hypothetical protein
MLNYKELARCMQEETTRLAIVAPSAMLQIVAEVNHGEGVAKYFQLQTA